MTRHLKETGFGYWEHVGRATRFSFFCFVASLKLLAHAIYPDWFPWTRDWLKPFLEEK